MTYKINSEGRLCKKDVLGNDTPLNKEEVALVALLLDEVSNRKTLPSVQELTLGKIKFPERLAYDPRIRKFDTSHTGPVVWHHSHMTVLRHYKNMVEDARFYLKRVCDSNSALDPELMRNINEFVETLVWELRHFDEAHKS